MGSWLLMRRETQMSSLTHKEGAGTGYGRIGGFLGYKGGLDTGLRCEIPTAISDLAYRFTEPVFLWCPAETPSS